MRDKSLPKEGRFAYEELDRVIHERARLSILTALVTQPKGLSFNDLKQLCALTDGNLNRHLSVLEQGEMIEILKKQDQNRPQTLCSITESGRHRYLRYLSALERVIKDAAREVKGDLSNSLPRGLTPSES